MLITNIYLKDVRCIKELKIDLTSNDGAKKWLLAVGDNGVGKSSLLRSLAIGLCDLTGASGLIQDTSGDFVRWGAGKATIEIDLIHEGNKYSIKTEITRDPRPDEEEISKKTIPADDFPWEKIFILGYGAHRSIEGSRSYEKYSSADALYTLFNYEYPLQNPELMLRRYAETPKEKEEICGWLDKILMLEPGSTILDRTGIAVKGKWGRYVYTWSLSDGYMSIITLVLDVLGWALLKDLKPKKNNLSGIVVIDEIEQHLHPEWQRHIISNLHTVFPEIQFIATSHSPLVAASLADFPDEICSLVLLARDIDDHQFVTSESLSTMRGWRYDKVLTSDAFGVQADRNDETDKKIRVIRELYFQKELTESDEKKLRELLDDLDEYSPVASDEQMFDLSVEEAKEIRVKLEQEEK